MKIESFDKLLADMLKDLYSAETQLVKALPKMAKAANAAGLKAAITKHLDETKGQVERLQQAGQTLGIKLTGKKCAAMEGLLEEAKEVLDADGPPEVLDAALIGGSQKIEHYEISGYGTARALAEHLGHADIAELLRQTEAEEAAADKTLTQVTEAEVLAVRAAAAEDDEAGEDDEAEAAPVAPAKKGGKKKK